MGFVSLVVFFFSGVGLSVVQVLWSAVRTRLAFRRLKAKLMPSRDAGTVTVLKSVAMHDTRITGFPVSMIPANPPHKTGRPVPNVPNFTWGIPAERGKEAEHE